MGKGMSLEKFRTALSSDATIENLVTTISEALASG